MSQPADVQPSRHLEDLQAPQVYVDLCLGGGQMAGDNIVLTFATKVLNHNYEPPLSQTRTALRLVLPRTAAAELAVFIPRLIDLQAGGHQAPVNTTLN